MMVWAFSGLFLQSTTSKTSITQLCPADQDVGELKYVYTKDNGTPTGGGIQATAESLPARLLLWRSQQSQRSCSRSVVHEPPAFWLRWRSQPKAPFLLPAVVLPGNQQWWSQQRYLFQLPSPPPPTPTVTKPCTSVDPKRGEVPGIPAPSVDASSIKAPKTEAQ